MISVLDQHGIKGYEDTIPQLRSIYHLANWFVYPLSYFLTDTHNRCTAYYQRWQQFYETWQPANGSKQALPETLEEQTQNLKQSWPKIYQSISQVADHLQSLKNNPDQADPFIEYIVNRIMKNPDIKHLSYIWVVSEDQIRQRVLKAAKNYLHNNHAQQFIDHYDDLVTVVLTVLMTPQAEPKPAMGHHEPTGKKVQHMHEDQKILYSDPQKDDQGNSVCLDHSAMLVPSDDMKKFVYEKTLMKTEGPAFSKFGTYKLHKGSGDDNENS